jgi:hypothetical protein
MERSKYVRLVSTVAVPSIPPCIEGAKLVAALFVKPGGKPEKRSFVKNILPVFIGDT